ncbi:dephospho-CoA kinase [Nocardia sp. NRRL S-836]|uniref:dephospho-CoA kinase n=1 Tax=Nocardia sp. NRRL S-836 TaxID=1519492 RepID=UPI0006B067CF|nr:dephospho-CoA kinase [Nocardia sp. NRRL S-836]KOV80781.1 dephospho-CoA kinase [Nocardia sp. NRRL S-836]
MLRVGLTGGIGSGKSTVARLLADRGATIIDADRLAREVLEPGTDGLGEVVAAFGDDVLNADGTLNRAALAAKAFATEEARQTLNGITHPRIGRLTAERMAAAPEDGVVVHDIPLLVERDMAAAYHLVVVVHADAATRLHRLVTSRGMAEADARQRIAAQATDEQRRAVADVWLDNSGEVPDVTALWDRLVGFEKNVRTRTYASGRPVVVPYDERWPAQAKRVARRISLAAGGRHVEHIGSTSVPGLAAKDVLDFQLAVEDMGTADDLREALAQAGFPYVGPYEDTPRGDDGFWDKRLHAGADPGRRVNLHLRVPGAANWQWAVDFRDWLRHDAQAREEYANVKLELSRRFAADGDGFAYGDAKEPFMEAAVERIKAYRGGQAS